MLPIRVPSWDDFELVSFMSISVGSHSSFLAWTHSNLGVGVVYPWLHNCNFKQFSVECQPDLSSIAGDGCVSRHLEVPWVICKQWRWVVKQELKRRSFTVWVMNQNRASSRISCQGGLFLGNVWPATFRSFIHFVNSAWRLRVVSFVKAPF